MRAVQYSLIFFFILFTAEATFSGDVFEELSDVIELPTVHSHKSSDPVTCGSTLVGKIYALTGDLDCSNATAPITVRDRGVLDLNNHSYIGLIVLDGRRAHLRNGKIQCILAGTNGGPLADDDRCVRVEGQGRHIVQNVFVTYESFDGFGIGIWVLSDNNFLFNNTLFRIPDAGVFVIGNNNILRQNKAILSNFGAGFHIDDGDENRLIGNYATMHGLGYGIDEGNNNHLARNVYAGVPDDVSINDEGFGIGFGSGNRLTRNVVTNEDLGIIMGNLTGPNTIDNNITIRNGVDLADFHDNCDVNTWRDNIFETSSPACIRGTATPLVSMSAVNTKAQALEKFTSLLLKLRKWNPKRVQR